MDKETIIYGPCIFPISLRGRHVERSAYSWFAEYSLEAQKKIHVISRRSFLCINGYCTHEILNSSVYSHKERTKIKYWIGSPIENQVTFYLCTEMINTKIQTSDLVAKACSKLT